MVVATDPFNAAKALTWLAGSTYGRTYDHLVPLALGCLVLVPVVWAQRRRMDLVSLDEDTPRVLGFAPVRARESLLTAAVLLTGVAVVTALVGTPYFLWLLARTGRR